MFRTHTTQIGSALGLLFILLTSAGCGGPTANTNGPPPVAVPNAAGGETVPWAAAPDPDTELARVSFEKPWQVMIPDTAKIVLPRVAGRLVVAWDEKGGRATVIDLRDGQAVGTVSVPEVAKARITSIDISRDGRRLAAADAARPSSALRCWSVDSGQETSVPLEKPEQAVVRFLASDRLLLATQALPDLGQIQLSVWNVKTQERLASYVVPGKAGSLLDDRNIAVSPGGRYCAILSGAVLSLYDAATGRCQGRMVADTELQRAWPTCRGLAFSEDGTELAAAVEVRSIIRLYGWDVASGAARFRQEVPRAVASVTPNWSELGPDLAWSPDGWVLFGTVIANGQTLTQTEQAPPRYHRLLNQQNALVIDTGYRDGRQRELALASRDALARPATASRAPIQPATASQAPVQPATASQAPTQPAAETPATWATPPDPVREPRQAADYLSLEVPQASGRVGYSYLPGPYAVVEERERFVCYDLRNGQAVSALRKREDESRATTSRPLCVSPNGRLFATLGRGLDVWSFGTGQSLRISEGGHMAFMAFARDDVLLTAAPESQTPRLCVKVWNVPAGTLRHELESTPQRSMWPSALAMSPGGCYLAAVETLGGSDAQLCLYEILTGRLVGQSTIEPGPGGASIGHWYGLAFSDDGTRLAGAWDYHGSSAMRFASWDATTGKCQATAELGEAAALHSETPIADLPWGESLKWNATGGGWLLFHTTHVDDQGKVAARLPRVAVRERDRLLLSQDRMLALVRSDQHASGLLTVLKLSSDVDQQLHRALARISSSAAKEAPPTASPAAVAQAEPPRPAATAPRQPSPRQPSEEPPPPVWKATIDPPTQPVTVKQPPRPVRAARLATFLYPRQPSPYVAMVEPEEGRCRLADLRTGKDAGAVSAKFEFRGKVAVSADGRYLAGENSADRGKAVSVWSFETGARCAEIDHSSVPFVDHIVFAGPDQLLVSQNDSEQYRITAWDVKQVKQVWATAIRKPRNADKVGVEASPGGKYIAVLIDRVLHVLEAATGQALGTSLLPVPWDVVTPRCVQCGALRFSPDGSELAAACSSHRLLLCWDFGSGELVLSRSFPIEMIADMDGGRLAWFPDKSGWLLGDNLVVERKTGAPVWRLDTRLRDPFQVLGLDSVLTVASANKGNEDQIVDVRLPGDQLTAAVQAARRAPSENVPPLTKPNLSGMESIPPNPGTDAWSYQPDGVAARDAAPGLSVSLGGPRIVLQEFRLATEDFGRAVLQTTVREEERRAVLPGPRQPLRRSQLQVYDTSQGKLLGEIETTGWSDMVDVSPEGSLVLTANSAEPQFGPYDRLDIWAPLLKKHAVGWQPVIVAAANREQQVTWAAFIDKRHVLTRSPAELVYWELPACQAKYRIASFGEVIALSPLRQHVVGLSADRGFRVYETATGRCLGRLEHPTCDKMSFPRGWFRPDGKQLLVLLWDLEHALVVVYDLTTGKIASSFGIPQVSPVELQWIDPRYVFLQTYPRDRGKRYLLDLENRALVAQYGAGVVCNVGRLDGSVWQAVAGTPGLPATFQLRERRFPLPATGPRLEDHAYLYPGAEVAISVNSSIWDRQDVADELTQRLTAAGLVVRASAARRFELEVVDSTAGRQAQLSDGRLLSSRSVELRWRSFEASGTKVWEQIRPLAWSAISVTNSESEAKQVTREVLREQARKAVSGLSIPRYLFPKIDNVKLPDSTL